MSLNPSGAAHPHAARREGLPQAAFISDLLPREDLARNRPGVLGIDVQLIGLEPVEEDRRFTEPAAMDGRVRPPLRTKPKGDITQDHGFGELFGADPDRVRRFVSNECQRNEQCKNGHQESPPTASSST